MLDLDKGRLSFVTPSPESTFRTADPNPRGGTRGTRGVSVYGERIVVEDDDVRKASRRQRPPLLLVERRPRRVQAFQKLLSVH